MSDINVVACIYHNDILRTKKRIAFFFKAFVCNINVVICCTGDQSTSPALETEVNVGGSQLSFKTINVSNSLMDIGAYISGYNAIENDGNLTIFMNDRFLTDFNTNMVSKYLFKDLFTLNSLKCPVLYGKLSYHGGLTQSSTVSDINYFIPTYFFAINSKSDELIQDWAREIKKIDTMSLQQLEYFLFQRYSRNLYNLTYEICMNKSSKYLWTNSKKHEASKKTLQKKMKCVVAEQVLIETFKQRSLIFALNDTLLRKIMVRVFFQKKWLV